MTAKAKAESFGEWRIRAWIDELKSVGIHADRNRFDNPDLAGLRIVLQTPRNEGISLWEDDQPDDRKPKLELREVYDWKDIHDGKRGGEIKLVNYSYAVAFDLTVDVPKSVLSGKNAEHWDHVWLTQAKRYHFDGENEDDWNRKPAEYRNAHPLHHFHPSAGERLRLPVSQRPTPLAVASWALISFDYDRWIEFARKDPEVVKATRLLLKDVESPS